MAIAADEAAERSRPASTSGGDGEQPAAGLEKAAGKKRRSLATKTGVAKFSRGEGINTKLITDHKLKAKVKYNERLVREASASAAKAMEWLLPADAGSLEAEGMEQTWRFKQEDIVQEAEQGAANKVFDLSLTELGPYRTCFTRNGRYMLIAGRRGHLATFDWQHQKLQCELQVKETTRDAVFLHNHLFFAAAQKKYAYIYDHRGVEVHCLKEHAHIQRMQFLPHHFLLASIGEQGVLTYQDTSHGKVVAQLKTKLGTCSVMAHNPWNAVLLLGHGNGTVTMWTPNITTPAVKMLCHKGPVRSVACDPSGRYMVTTGADQQVKVWDVRTFKPLHAYFSPAPVEAADISQRGLVAVSYGRRVQVWKDALASKASAPYMTHMLPGGAAVDLKFCPYEDVLAAGHTGGMSTMLVPGAGEPNYDSWVADPFMTRQGRRQQEVVQLLDKLQPEMIVMDPEAIATLRKEPAQVAAERRAEQQAANAARLRQQREKNEAKTKMKGKNRPSRRAAKKQQNIIEEKKPGMLQRIKEQQEQAAKAARQKEREAELAEVPKSLHRFFPKR